MKFFVGLDRASDAQRFARCMISVNTLRRRRSDFAVGEWLLDSGAFTEITKHGAYREPPEAHAERVDRWARCGTLLRAISQDYMCEPFVLAKTGLTVAEHQARTVERYERLRALVRRATVMPVLQGWTPADYADHVRQYGRLLEHGAWVGVGSVCKRNASPLAIEAVLSAIVRVRPDLRLHGFGVKLTALRSDLVRQLLFSADSMAWSFHARKQGRDGHDIREAERYVARVERELPEQTTLRLV